MNAPAKTEEFVSAVPAGVFAEKVLSVTHYTDRLFRFTMTRPQGFRFRSGEFAMIGLMVDGKPLYRAYSIASPAWAEELEFFSIKVPDGPLTSHLQNIKPGDEVLMRKKPTGTLVLDALTPGKRLYMFSTGTGIAPFASLIRDPETYEKFEEVILTHTTRDVAELKYGFDLVEEIRNDELLSEVVGDKLRHYATVTREDYPFTGRITDLMENGKLFTDLGIPALDPEIDRGMICGSSAMLKDTKELLEKAGLNEGANSKPAEFVIERAFVG
ncbi:ferredoxin--NADP reductase [Agrobacterium sp. SHOUNA12C]|uniref:ferredoxin--NADP(+) reductase n=2 Tax=Rhizobium rhizogenes TaxID=359 RepID=B9JF16_RHIR8|nr:MULTISPECIES: ferredoxin--NADP reductase [Rhizobium]ACM26507.1 ferredoxin-NADP+ reductase protein [Rhizobium rhizogenes K84]KAA6490652.1 ferredoxin--NADP reductase [Agrobacterium sp. ICMP 7243]MCJ9721895.1 ferredoxin--NADP reductase [Agrobacterium sp. BETTINA12B]MCJ9756609.1 ferredoxin--NADP reductase [Agrobacterium sp. SHOUNA12C]OCJ06164.1 ferredoxin--NADP(+) reductase [Agrobacterium sp. 13-626]OCJ25643.1 ferredoxin--NADP(+) reductase [Agrobacterium sp. B131/95]OCJ31273.1 ferredoxin--NAD